VLRFIKGGKMSDEFAKLTVPEIQSLIERAHAEIARRKDAAKEDLKAEIAKKLKSAGLEFEDLFPSADKKARKSKSRITEGNEASERVVVAKYKNHVTGDTWSGRGPHPPQWVRSVMSERNWTLEEFKRSTDFLAQT
jgi:DNA-binding protein H-NS